MVIMYTTNYSWLVDLLMLWGAGASEIVLWLVHNTSFVPLVLNVF